MPRRFVLVVGCLCLLAAGSAAAGTSHVVCGPAGAKTLAADRVARVYSQGGNVYGCAGPQSYKLGSSGHSVREGRVGPIALAGVDAGYGLTNYGVDTVSAEVVVRRLSDGKVLRDQSAFVGNVGPEAAQQVDDVVVRRDGSVAWIAEATSIPSSSRHGIQVRKSDRTKRTLLDSNPKIRPHSLRRQGSRLTWRDGSVTRSATLR